MVLLFLWAKCVEVLHIVLTSLYIGYEIFYGHFGLENVGGTNEQTALASRNVKIFEYLSAHVVGGAEGHRGLCADGAVKREAVAKLVVYILKIHTFGLYGVKDVYARINKVRYHRRNEAAGMIEYKNVGVYSLRRVYYTL